jgi:hypothetical protein
MLTHNFSNWHYAELMSAQNHIVLTSVSTSFLADRLVAVLMESDIESFARPGGAASNDLVSAASPGFFDVLVDAAKMSEAKKLVASELADIERDSELNAQAAEEESMSGENPVA